MRGNVTDTSGQTGMSLLELMVSVAILSVIMLSLIYGLGLNIKVSANSRLMNSAVTDLMALRDEILAAPFDNTMTLFPPSATYTGSSLLPEEVLTVTYLTAAGVDPMRIRVSVSFRNKDRRTQSYQLEFLKKK